MNFPTVFVGKFIAFFRYSGITIRGHTKSNPAATVLNAEGVI